MKQVFLKDYKAPTFTVYQVSLTLQLDKTSSKITNEFSLKLHNLNSEETQTPIYQTSLILDGLSTLKLENLSIDGRTLIEGIDFERIEDELIIKNPPLQANYKVETTVYPDKNTSGEGLYYTNGVLVTQNESTGFSNMTFFPDRPDIRAPYRVRLEAKKEEFPTLLSNPMKTASGDLDNGYHFAEFEDPNPKPSYLFCVVAGKIDCIQKDIIYPSGNKVTLKLWANPKELKDGQMGLDIHAQTLLNYERDYGFEYDLPEFNVIGVPDFNNGAMENTGLNVYNTPYLMTSLTHNFFSNCTFAAKIIPHELAHHISGNRIGIQGNWFNLAVKEGLAEHLAVVEFEKVNQSKVARIDSINSVRTSLIPYDNGPQSHPVRMQSYENLDNMYDCITYTKGSELWYTLRGLVGEQIFKDSIAEYAKTYVNQMATIENLTDIIQRRSGEDLSQFLLWWDQSGTPEVTVSEKYNENSKTYELTFKQHTPSLNNEKKLPLQIPVAIKLFSQDGQVIPIMDENDDDDSAVDEAILNFNSAHQVFTFTKVDSHPIPSLFRNMSAPVFVKQTPLDTAGLLVLMENENDFVAKWDSAKSLYKTELGRIYKALKANTIVELDDRIIQAWGSVLNDNTLAIGERLAILSLPSNKELFQYQSYIDHETIQQAKVIFQLKIATVFKEELLHQKFMLFQDLVDAYSPENEARVNLIQLINHHLKILARECQDPEIRNELATEAKQLYDNFQALELKNMALKQLYDTYDKSGDVDWTYFQKAYHDMVESNNYIGLHGFYAILTANANGLKNIALAQALPSYNKDDAKDVYALWSPFATSHHFHQDNGAAYDPYIDETIRLSTINASTAGRMMRATLDCNKFDIEHCEQMRNALQKIIDNKDSSENILSIAKSILQQPSQNEVVFKLQLDYIQNCDEKLPARQICGELPSFYRGKEENTFERFINNLIGCINGEKAFMAKDELNNLILQKSSVFREIFSIGAPELLNVFMEKLHPHGTEEILHSHRKPELNVSSGPKLSDEIPGLLEHRVAIEAMSTPVASTTRAEDSNERKPLNSVEIHEQLQKTNPTSVMFRYQEPIMPIAKATDNSNNSGGPIPFVVKRQPSSTQYSDYFPRPPKPPK